MEVLGAQRQNLNINKSKTSIQSSHTSLDSQDKLNKGDRADHGMISGFDSNALAITRQNNIPKFE